MRLRKYTYKRRLFGYLTPAGKVAVTVSVPGVLYLCFWFVPHIIMALGGSE